ncbi:MAG TPA: tRNA lysidine(34) synthetase TilS [Bacteroidales bacterium]|nr:tRNA lysidine(34) synthetase TilS [Bacteroidales bacterium]
MTDDFKKYIRDNNLAEDTNRILLAVSGGIDSMVMTHLFLSSGYETGIAHCNFSLRAGESDMDENLVAEFARNNNMPFFTKKFDTKKYAASKGMSIQMAARELRYEWFEKIRSENRYDLIAVAHNLNDNIETLIINLTRGTGLAGLAGIRNKNNYIIRPLLFATRERITEYCNINRISYREDRSNADTKYTRNKIRHKVIPVLKEINPSIESTLNETADRFSDINLIVNEYITKLSSKISEQKGDNISFNIYSLRKHLDNRAVIFELFRNFGVTSVQINDLINVIRSNTGAQLFTDSHRILKNRNELIVSTEQKNDDEPAVIETIDDLQGIPGIVSASFSDITDTFEIPSDPSVACLDASRITFPLIIRKWKAGDYFIPLGMKQKKKLSDYFIDNKYSIIDKENKMILECNGSIVWIVGDRIDNRFRITRNTQKALIINSRTKELEIKPLN